MGLIPVHGQVEVPRTPPRFRLFRQRKWFQQITIYVSIWRNTRTGRIFFQNELQRLLGCDEAWLRQTAQEYLARPEAWQLLSALQSPSRRMDGFAKSLDVAEGFALWALVKMLRPLVVVELGVNLGISSRLWKEALNTYVPNHQLILCDLVDKRMFIGDQDAKFIQGDAFESLPQLFREYSIDILHNDAHPYDLIHWSVSEAMKLGVPCLTFHDVGKGRRGGFRPESSRLTREERLAQNTNWQQFGLWERHVMAELIDERVATEDWVSTPEWNCQIFDSLFGFGVALRRAPNHAPHA